MVQNQLIQVLGKTTNKYCYWCCCICRSNNAAAISLFFLQKDYFSSFMQNVTQQIGNLQSQMKDLNYTLNTNNQQKPTSGTYIRCTAF